MWAGLACVNAGAPGPSIGVVRPTRRDRTRTSTKSTTKSELAIMSA